MEQDQAVRRTADVPAPDTILATIATFRHARVGTTALLVVAGRIGPLSAAELRRELHRLLLRGERCVVVDVSAAEFDGPSGPVAIILARRVMRAHGGPLTLATREGRGPHSEPWFGLEPTTWEE